LGTEVVTSVYCQFQELAHIEVGVKREISWKGVGDKKEADWLRHLWGGDRGEIYKEEKRG
jgi:hypothetical protein